MVGVGSLEHDLAFGIARFGKSMMHVVRSHEPDPGMPMFIIVPSEEIHTVHPGVLDGVEVLREIGPVLHRLELRFRKWVVVGRVRPRMRLRDAQIGQQERHWLGSHR